MVIILFSVLAGFYLLIKILEPIHIKNDGIVRISILGIEGEALMGIGSEIEDGIKTINSVKAIKGKKSLYKELGGDTPDIKVSFSNNKDEVLHSVSFYGSVIRCDDTYYKIIGQEIQYGKIRKLCDKYGRSSKANLKDENIENSDDRVKGILSIIFLFIFILICMRVIMKKINNHTKKGCKRK